MVISYTEYYIFIGVMVLIIAALYFFFKRRKKENISSVVMILGIVLLAVININTPRKLTVEGCDKYTEEVILFPTSLGEVKTSLGKATYIVNNSDTPLGFEYIYYGDHEAKEDEEDVLIMPGEVQRVKGITVDYVFTEPDSSVRIKGSGATKSHLLCLTNLDEEVDE